MEEFKVTQESQENLEGTLKEIYDLVLADPGISLEKESGDAIDVQIKGTVKDPNKTFTVEFNTTRGKFQNVLKHELEKELKGFEFAKLVTLNRDIQSKINEEHFGGYAVLK